MLDGVLVASENFIPHWMLPFHTRGYTCAVAAAFNRLDELKYLVARGWHVNSDVSELAVKNGHTDLLYWAIANAIEVGEGALNCAAARGDMDMLRWLHTKLRRVGPRHMRRGS